MNRSRQARKLRAALAAMFAATLGRCLAALRAWKQRIPVGIRQGILAAMIVAGIRWLDPFGIDHVLFEQTGLVHARLSAAAYPGKIPAERRLPGLKADFARDQIVVVAIDDAYFQHELRIDENDRITWPLPLHRVTELLDQVLEAGPRMVFLDMVLAEDRYRSGAWQRSDAGARPVPPASNQAESKQDGTTQRAPGKSADISAEARELRALLQTAKDAGTPILLADLPASPGPPVCNLNSGPQTSRNGGQGEADKFPGIEPPIGVVMDGLACAAAGLSPVLWTAPDGTYPATINVDPRPTPAFQLYDLLYTRKTGALPGPAGAPRDPLQMVWSVAPSIPYNAGCPYTASPLGLLDRVRLIRNTVLSHRPEFEKADDTCLPIPWISAARLFEQDGAEEVNRLLAGRVVLVGAAWSTTLDTTVSPIHGRLPGVFVHAMALDNLMTYGSGYPRAELISEDEHDKEVWISALIIGLSIGIARTARLTWPARIGGWWEYCISGVLAVTSAIATSAVVPLSSSLTFALAFIVIVVHPILLIGGGHHPFHDGDGGHGERA